MMSLENLESQLYSSRLTAALSKLRALQRIRGDSELKEEELLNLNNEIFAEFSYTYNSSICENNTRSYAFFLYILSFRRALWGDSARLIETGELITLLHNTENTDEPVRRNILRSVLKDWRQIINNGNIMEQYSESSRPLELALLNRAEPGRICSCGYLADKHTLDLNRHLGLITESRLRQLAADVSGSFIKSFELSGAERKPPAEGAIIRLIYRPGYERIILMIKEELERLQYRVLVVPPFSAQPENEAVFGYFLNFYAGLMDEELCELDFYCFKKAVEMYSEDIERNCGFIDIMSFSRRKTAPLHQPSMIPDENSVKHFISLNARKVNLLKKYLNPEKTSFCFFPMPRPSGENNFPELLSGVLDVNSGKNWIGEALQESLVTSLDKAAEIRIEGTNGNETSMVIAMAGAEEEGERCGTNFNNTGMAQNIPAGEIFTTPQLAGTQGVFHLKSFYFQGHRFENLRLYFEDGRIQSCNSSSGPELVKNILMGGHESLPIGELGIGTNAGAYKLISDFDLYETVPTLIAEKTAPHIAIGDSCYARKKTPVYNEYSGKEIHLAVNNAKLYNIHLDMTLPLNEIGLLSARIPGRDDFILIRDGAYIPHYLKEMNE